MNTNETPTPRSDKIFQGLSNAISDHIKGKTAFVKKVTVSVTKG